MGQRLGAMFTLFLLVVAACGSEEQGFTPAAQPGVLVSAAEDTKQQPSHTSTVPPDTTSLVTSEPEVEGMNDVELTTSTGPVRLPDPLDGFEIFKGPASASGIPGVDLEYVLYVDAKRGMSYSVGVVSGAEVEQALVAPEQYGYQVVADVEFNGALVLGRNLTKATATAPTELVWQISSTEAMSVTSGTIAVDQLKSLVRTMETSR